MARCYKRKLSIKQKNYQKLRTLLKHLTCFGPPPKYTHYIDCFRPKHSLISSGQYFCCQNAGKNSLSCRKSQSFFLKQQKGIQSGSLPTENLSFYVVIVTASRFSKCLRSNTLHWRLDFTLELFSIVSEISSEARTEKHFFPYSCVNILLFFPPFKFLKKGCFENLNGGEFLIMHVREQIQCKYIEHKKYD